MPKNPDKKAYSILRPEIISIPCECGLPGVIRTAQQILIRIRGAAPIQTAMIVTVCAILAAGLEPSSVRADVVTNGVDFEVRGGSPGIASTAFNNRLPSAFDSVTANEEQAVALDRPGGRSRIGNLMGWLDGYSSISVDTHGFSGDSEWFALRGYTSYQLNEFGFRLGASTIWQRITTKLDLTTDHYSDDLSADYAVAIFQAFDEVGYKQHMTPFARVEPSAGLALVNQRTGDLVKEGGNASLSDNSSHEAVGIFSFGNRFERLVSNFIDDGVLLNGSLGWRPAQADPDPPKTMHLSQDNAFRTARVYIEQDVAPLDLGLRHAINGTFFDVSYYNKLGNLAKSQDLNLNVPFNF